MPWNYYVDQAGVQLTEICLLNAEIKGMHHNTLQKQFLKSVRDMNLRGLGGLLWLRTQSPRVCDGDFTDGALLGLLYHVCWFKDKDIVNFLKPFLTKSAFYIQPTVSSGSILKCNQPTDEVFGERDAIYDFG